MSDVSANVDLESQRAAVAADVAHSPVLPEEPVSYTHLTLPTSDLV